MINRRSLCRSVWSALCVLLVSVAPGCQDSPQRGAEIEGSQFESVKPTVDPEQFEQENRQLTADEMRGALGANETARFEKTGRKFSMALLANSGAKTLEPLRGQALKVLDISQTRITDLSPLEGMPLENIGFAETKISDLSALKGMPLRHLDGNRSDVVDLSPLEGMTSLSHLFLDGAKVSDLGPLNSAALQVVWLNGCPIEDLSPLGNKQLEELNLCDTPLQKLDSLKDCQIGTLWIRNTQVQDLAPLSGKELISLDIQGTPIQSLAALSNMTSLKRLNIADTAVTDLTPLASLSLDRLIFTPSRITAGIETIRSMTSLQALDLTFDGVSQPLAPSVFWERYDAGEFKAETN